MRLSLVSPSTRAFLLILLRKSSMPSAGSSLAGYGRLDLAVEQVFAACTTWFSEINEPVARVFAEYRLCSGKRCGHMLSDNGQQVGDKPRVMGLPPKVQRGRMNQRDDAR